MKWLCFLGWLVSSTMYAQPFSILIGVSTDNPPFSIQSDGKNHFYGFEIDLMNEICNRIKVKCEYKPVIVSEITSELSSGHIDLAIAAIIRPPTPLNGFIFSVPYLPSGAKFMALKESEINTPNDIINKTVGVRRGTLGAGHLFEDLILKKYNNTIKISEYITTEDIFMALTNKEVDIIFTNEAVVKYWYYNNMELYKIIGATIPVGDGYVIMATTRYEALVEKINQALFKIFSDGTYQRIYNTYLSF